MRWTEDDWYINPIEGFGDYSGRRLVKVESDSGDRALMWWRTGGGVMGEKIHGEGIEMYRWKKI